MKKALSLVFRKRIRVQFGNADIYIDDAGVCELLGSNDGLANGVLHLSYAFLCIARARNGEKR